MAVKVLKIRIAGLVPESYVDGEGIRFAIFMQGCLRNCAGCHNPETHDLNGGKIIDTSEIIAKIKINPMITSIGTGRKSTFIIVSPPEINNPLIFGTAKLQFQISQLLYIFAVNYHIDKF